VQVTLSLKQVKNNATNASLFHNTHVIECLIQRRIVFGAYSIFGLDQRDRVLNLLLVWWQVDSF
jgi:hypothetical protein